MRSKVNWVGSAISRPSYRSHYVGSDRFHFIEVDLVGGTSNYLYQTVPPSDVEPDEVVLDRLRRGKRALAESIHDPSYNFRRRWKSMSTAAEPSIERCVLAEVSR